MRTKILIVGDSLTKGHPGAGYIRFLKQELPETRIKSEGRGGRTLRDTALILPTLLKKHRPDLLVIETGTNDLLLPFLKERGGKRSQRIQRKLFDGGIPLSNPAHFRTIYASSLKMLSAWGFKSPFLITIACLGENPRSPLNRKRRMHNEVIRDLCARHEAHLIDTASRFEEILNREPESESHLPDAPGNIHERFLKKLSGVSDSLSRRRGLQLTIDGVHFNRRGARIYAHAVQKALRPFL